MKQLSLKKKIYTIGGVPFICFLIAMVIYPLKSNYNSYQEASILKSKMDVIEAASSVVHESQKEMLNVISVSSSSLMELINDILDLAKIYAQKQ